MKKFKSNPYFKLTMTSDDVSSEMKSGGITTSRYPICKKPFNETLNNFITFQNNKEEQKLIQIILTTLQKFSIFRHSRKQQVS